MRKPSRVVAHRGDDDGPCHTILAATNKCLAQSNKSRTGGEPICYCTVSAPCARVSRNRAHLHSAGTAKVCHELRSAMTSVTEWLVSNGLGEYAQRFAENGVDASVLRDLTEQDLKDLRAPPCHPPSSLPPLPKL